MADPLPLRALRFGLRAVSRASGSLVERVLRGGDPPPFVPGARDAVQDPRAPVRVTLNGQALDCARGATLLEVADAARVDLRSYCGGNCSCGTCRITVVSGAKNLGKRGSLEEMVLGSEAVARGDRLACQAAVLGPVEVLIPEWF